MKYKYQIGDFICGFSEIFQSDIEGTVSFDCVAKKLWVVRLNGFSMTLDALKTSHLISSKKRILLIEKIDEI